MHREPAGLLVGMEPSIGPRSVGRGLEDGVQVHRAVHARNRLTMGIGLLDADLRLEPVRVDQQQDEVGPAGVLVVGGRGMLRWREAADDAVAVHRRAWVFSPVGG
jgi:hypothetical protein